MAANSVDHVTPRSLVQQLEAAGLTIRRRHLRTVPACLECNAIAGDKVFAGVQEKRQYIHGRLRQKHARLLAAPGWSDRQLAELGVTLRSYVEQRQALRSELLARLRWPQKVPGSD